MSAAEQLHPHGIGKRLQMLIGVESVSAWCDKHTVDRSTITRALAGQTVPSTRCLHQIAQSTGASVDWILFGQGQSRREKHHVKMVARTVPLGVMPMSRLTSTMVMGEPSSYRFDYVVRVGTQPWLDANQCFFLEMDTTRFTRAFNWGDLLLFGRQDPLMGEDLLYGTFIDDNFSLVTIRPSGKDSLNLFSIEGQERVGSLAASDCADRLLTLCGWWQNWASRSQNLVLTGSVSRRELLEFMDRSAHSALIASS